MSEPESIRAHLRHAGAPQKRSRSATLRQAAVVTLLVLILLSLLAWWLTRDVLPEQIRIATAESGGLYYRFGKLLAEELERRCQCGVEVLETRGSVENLEMLRQGRAELAVVQAGSGSLEGHEVLAPLYRDVVHVIVRRGLGMESVHDLRGRRLALGPTGSGTRYNAQAVLRHYRIDYEALQEKDRYFGELKEDQALEAAIITTGLLNPDLQQLLAGGQFDLLPILVAKSLSLRHHHFSAFEIPRGFFGEDAASPVPPEDTLTVASTSLLMAGRGTSGRLVQETLSALYGSRRIRRQIPTLLTQSEAALWSDLPLHPSAAEYHRPYGGLGILANFMETLAALKELLFALGAALYLGWGQYQRVQERERQAAMQRDKDHLDDFLEETIRIEKAQMESDDPARLRRYLDQVTEIKLRALEELTHEDLRGDVNFSIFLQQCTDVVHKIQAKLEVLLRNRAQESSGKERISRQAAKNAKSQAH